MHFFTSKQQKIEIGWPEEKDKDDRSFFLLKSNKIMFKANLFEINQGFPFLYTIYILET